VKDHPLRKIMHPRSLAFYGASNNILKMGSILMANLLASDFQGSIYPVHLKEKQVMNLQAYPRAQEIPHPVDVAVLVLPTEVVPEALEDLGQAGIQRAVIISGGFGEIPGGEGGRLQKRLVEVAREHGIRFIGPNCIGIFSHDASLNTTPFGNAPGGKGIAFASQSGAFTCQTYELWRKLGASINQTISVGNEADLDLADCLEYLVEEDNVTSVCLYIESIRRPRQFIRAARRLVEAKPVTAIYVGGTEAGARASLSHTAAISGSEELYDGILRQAGIAKAKDVEELFDITWTLATLPPMKGDRVAVITNSGGPGASMAYQCEKAGLRVPSFSAALQDKLHSLLPPTAYCVNPVDITYALNLLLLRDIAQIIFESGEADAALIYGFFGKEFVSNLAKVFPDAIESFAGVQSDFFLTGVQEIALLPKQLGMPAAVLSFSGPESEPNRIIMRNGMPVFSSARRCARALVALRNRSRAMQ